MTAYAGPPSVMNYQILTIAIGPNVYGQIQNDVYFFPQRAQWQWGDDYKDWDWSEGSGTFGNVLAYWLEGLMTTTINHIPTYHELSPRKNILKKYPLAIVNSKKIAGGSSSNWKIIWKYAERDKSFLRTQIREILKPNIIVCGGSNDAEDGYRKVLSIALEYVFPDIKDGFKKINNWCYYNLENDILLIDSYHPSIIMNEKEKIEGLINGFHDFILKTNYIN